jgi:hypothetical protein
VLDVNRDFQPWLIERARLFAAMDTWEVKKKRGLLDQATLSLTAKGNDLLPGALKKTRGF